MKKHKSTYQLAVVLVNYNSFEDTKACVKSIRQHETAPSFIVIVDNSSPNQSELDTLMGEHLKIIYSDENLGFGKANNIGIEWVRNHLESAYTLLLNNDTIVTPNALNSLIAPFSTDETIGLTTGKIMYADTPELVWFGGADVNYKKGWPDVADLNQPASAEGANKSRYVTFATGCVMMFSKQCIEELNGFDEAFFMYCEDLELSMRTTKSGYTIYYTADSLIYHKVHGSTNEQSADKTTKNLDLHNPNYQFLFYHIKSNQFLAMQKHLKTGQFIRFNAYFWARYHYFVLRMIFRGKLSVIIVSIKTKFRILKMLFSPSKKTAAK